MASDGRVSLITGGSRGIGKAIALQLASQGVQVAVNYISNKTAADEVVKLIEKQGASAVAVQGDVTKRADVERIFTTTAGLLGPVEILVNNAGIISDSLLMRMSDEDWDSVIDLDLRAREQHPHHLLVPTPRRQDEGRPPSGRLHAVHLDARPPQQLLEDAYEREPGLKHRLVEAARLGLRGVSRGFLSLNYCK